MSSIADQRQYPISDDKLVVHAGVIKSYIIKHHTTFMEFNSVKFHPKFHEQLGLKIDQAKATTSDAFILKTQAKATAKVDEARTALQKSLNTISFVVKICFEGNEKSINEFRFAKLSEYAKNADKFMGFAKDVLVLIEAHKNELLAAGLKEPLIRTIQEQITELDIARRAQIETIQSRPTLTKERIDKMNDVWRELTDIKNAAVIIFEDQPELKSLFELPKALTKTSDEENDEIPVDPTVPTQL